MLPQRWSGKSICVQKSEKQKCINSGYYKRIILGITKDPFRSIYCKCIQFRGGYISRQEEEGGFHGVLDSRLKQLCSTVAYQRYIRGVFEFAGRGHREFPKNKATAKLNAFTVTLCLLLQLNARNNIMIVFYIIIRL